MISDRDLVTVGSPGQPYTYGTMPRADAERAIEARRVAGRLFTLTPVPSCRCCGEPAWANLRCSKHQDRNPCVVEGCTRTAKAHRGELRDDQTICGTHWKAYVPPRSPERRAYHRFWRLAKKQGGWDLRLIVRFERFWTGLVARVRRRSSEGHLDQAAIERMFGWSDEA